MTCHVTQLPIQPWNISEYNYDIIYQPFIIMYVCIHACMDIISAAQMTDFTAQCNYC